MLFAYVITSKLCFQAELDESLNEIKKLDELAKKAMSDAARLADELRQEQEHSMHIERLRKGLEQQLKVRWQIFFELKFFLSEISI